MAARRVTLKGWACTCERCGHAWRVLGAALPGRCARCKSPNWNRARVYKPRAQKR